MGRRRVRMTNKPSYRFEDYAEPWEQRKLGEIVDITSGDAPAKFFEGNTPYVKVDDLNYCDKYLTATQNHVDTSYKIKKIEKGSVVFPKRGAAILTNKIRILNVQAYMDTNMMSLNTDKANLEFLYTVISNIGLYKIADTSTIPQINNKHILPYPIYFPTLPEQTAIGSFFQDIDQLISLQQRKLEVLKEQKKTYLKLLFPAKRQTKPDLRFAGFEDEWKEVKLGEYCDIVTGKLDANAMVSDGEYDFYTSGIQKYKIDVAAFEGPAITIAGNGATVGYMHYADGKFNAYQRTYVLSNFLVDRSFIYSEIGRKLPSKIQQEARTGNIPYIVMDMLTKLDICLPSLPEQESIGAFFQDLDKAIAKQEEKINQLKESKQTLLRKMFI